MDRDLDQGDAFEIRPATSTLPADLAWLAEEAKAEGVRNVDVLIAQWRDGSETYSRPGEALLVAWHRDESAVGVGGLAQCPDVEGALRVRRFYVAPDQRRRGIARRLAVQLITTGLRDAHLLTCNARASSAAPLFWEAMGFEPVESEGITHVLRRTMPTVMS